MHMAGINVADVEAFLLQTFSMREKGNKWVCSNEFKDILSHHQLQRKLCSSYVPLWRLKILGSISFKKVVKF